MVLVCPRYCGKTCFVLSFFGQIPPRGIGTTWPGADKAGTQIHGVRFHLGKLCRHSQVGHRTSPRAFSLNNGDCLRGLTKLAFPQSSGLEASPLTGAAIATLPASSATGNSLFLHSFLCQQSFLMLARLISGNVHASYGVSPSSYHSRGRHKRYGGIPTCKTT
jgi:hypothetical protein